MSMYTLLRNKPIPNMEDIDTYFQASLKGGQCQLNLDVCSGKPLPLHGLPSNPGEPEAFH